jgi:hypothetical protein
VDLSGVIFVVLAIIWAVYLIPKALKSHDEVARTRSVDRFSDDARVVARREPVSRRDARLVVNPPPSTPVQASVPTEPVVLTGRDEDRRTAGKVAARRRRRILLALLLLVAATAAGAYLGQLPRWSPVLPGGVVVLFAVLCRTQVRRQRSRRPQAGAPRRRPTAPVHEHVEPEPSMAEPARSVQPASPPQPLPEPEPEPLLQTEPEPLADQVAEPAGSAMLTPDTGALWDPVPVTLPTYVTKPKASRTVRTIDLGAAGAWTSGRTPEDAEIAARATDPTDSDGRSPKAGQRAVGT